ncbi:MAG: O-antigen translocase [Flavobacterium sp.]|nr:MAG: O-antigen translocase [Flavobacterium sp.]
MKFIRENKLYKVLSLNAASVGVSMALGVFSTKIISIFLGTMGMALIGSFRNFTSMLRSLATLGISNSIIKLFIENRHDKKELSAIYATFFWIFLSLSIAIGLLTIGMSTYISNFLFKTDDFTLPIWIFALLLPFVVLNTFWMAIYNGLEMFRKIVVIQIISNVLVFLITALFIYNGNIQGGLVSVAVSELAMVIVTYVFIRRERDYFTFSLQRIGHKKHASVIGNFSIMALLSALIVPITLILIRNRLIDTHSITDAGIWDGVNRLSGFYMMFFSSGLSLYYLPKLSSLATRDQFRSELGHYFKMLVPLFAAMLLVVFLFRGLIVDIAFTPEFKTIKHILLWQLAGDFIRILTLAFGYQILVKTMMKEYFLIEIVFNLAYLIFAFYLMQFSSALGVLQAYFFANVICLVIMLVIFRKVILNKTT